MAEPELRVVGPDARLVMDNKYVYVLDSDLAGEKVEVWYSANGKAIQVKDSQGEGIRSLSGHPETHCRR